MKQLAAIVLTLFTVMIVCIYCKDCKGPAEAATSTGPISKLALSWSCEKLEPTRERCENSEVVCYDMGYGHGSTCWRRP